MLCAVSEPSSGDLLEVLPLLRAAEELILQRALSAKVIERRDIAIIVVAIHHVARPASNCHLGALGPQVLEYAHMVIAVVEDARGRVATVVEIDDVGLKVIVQLHRVHLILDEGVP